MAITNLTGTTWVFNETVNVPTSATYPLEFNSTQILCTSLILSDDERSHNITIEYTGISGFVYDLTGGKWKNESYRTIEIVGGTSATNADLISWLESNATQQESGGGTTSRVTLNEQYLQDTANAIRSKTGESGTMTPAQFADAIGSISGGGTLIRVVYEGGSYRFDKTAQEILDSLDNGILPVVIHYSGNTCTYTVLKLAYNYLDSDGYCDFFDGDDAMPYRAYSLNEYPVRRTSGGDN